MAAPPYMTLYIGDYLADTMHLTTEEHGAYLLLIFAYWRRGGALPDDDGQLARMVRQSAAGWRALRPTLEEFFEIDGGAWTHKRVEQELARAAEKGEKARKSAESRWASSKPKAASKSDANAMRTHSERTANADANALRTHEVSMPNAYANGMLPDSEPEPEIRTRPGRVATPPVEQGSTDRSDAGAVQRVFDHWRSVHDHPRAALDDKRRRLIRRALQAYSEADLCGAIAGYRNSPHHQGRNDTGTVYDSIELILRDAAHIDAGIRFQHQPPLGASSPEQARTQRNLDSLAAVRASFGGPP